jgi:hypothetical protein
MSNFSEMTSMYSGASRMSQRKRYKINFSSKESLTPKTPALRRMDSLKTIISESVTLASEVSPARI